MKKMTSRERVHAAMEHREPDRIPTMLWIEAHTVIRLATDVRPPKRRAHRMLWRGVRDLARAMPNEDLGNAIQLLTHFGAPEYFQELGADILDVMWSAPPLWLRGLDFKDGHLSIKDMYGGRRGVGGMYMEIEQCPCPDEESLYSYEFPDVSSPAHHAHIRLARLLHPDAFIVCSCPGMQDFGQFIHPMEKLYTGMVYYPEAIKHMFNKLCEHSLEIIRGSLRAGADGILILDDYGTQNSMFISRNMWKDFTYPHFRRQIDEIHKHGGKAMLHSCGTVAPLLDLFVEAGLDALHPFQHLPGNNLEKAVDEFGDRLCFVGGMDVQRAAAMSPDEVYEDIMNFARVAGRGPGGLVLSHSNGLQCDTPTENLRAMFRAIDDVREKRF